MSESLISQRCWAWGAAVVLSLAGTLAQAQTSGFEYPNFNAQDNLALQGGAVAVSATATIRIAGAGAQVGGLWHAHRQGVGGGLDTTFRFRITSNGGTGTDEGFAFVVQGGELPGLSGAGAGLGYAGVPASLAIEFDTVGTPAHNEPAVAHISVQSRGLQPNSAAHTASLGATTNLPNFADGQAHTARIRSLGNSLEVYVDDLGQPCVSVTIPSGAEGQPGSVEELLGLPGEPAWVGFTASTVSGALNFDLLNWQLSPASAPVTVAVAMPPDGASFMAPARINLQAAVTGTGVVERVEFFADHLKIGEAQASPWELQWKDVAPGTYLLRAVASVQNGPRTFSQPATITVYPVVPPIGLNFSSTVDGSGALAFIDQAGIVPQRVWNNLVSDTNGNGSASGLRTGGGVQTSARASWNFAGVASVSTVDPIMSGDFTMMKSGVVDLGPAGLGQINSTITVQNIPFAIYDVLVYGGDGSGAGDRVTQFQIRNDVIYMREAAWASFAGIHVEADGQTDEGAGTPAGTYVRFSNQTNSSFALTVTAHSATEGHPRALVTGIQIVPSISSVPLQVTRGPYLQIGTPTSMVVRWRTNRGTDSRVRYGTSPSALTGVVEDLRPTTEHIVTLTNLQPYTKYYYAVGNSDTNLATGAELNFRTHPTNAVPTRIWWISDYGFGNADQRSVRDSYYTYVASEKPADVWITGGDNDQVNGADANYQNDVFGMTSAYGALLRNLPVFPTIGNHDYQTGEGVNYYANFSMPISGEAGGVPSGSEHYYSFNYGDVHFISLDSIDGTHSRTPNTAMLQWLREDLTAATQRWVIAYWHGPPYSKGSHDSDDTSDTLAWMTQMRENVLPILESFQVDLVLCGHSHVYERTWPLFGHYGFSTSFSETNKVQTGDGKMDGTGGYRPTDKGMGTVYITAGISGQPRTITDEQHPAHLLKKTGILGSLVIDIEGDRLDLKYLNTSGVAEDYFTILKEADTSSKLAIWHSGGVARVAWPTSAEGYQLQFKSEAGAAVSWQTITNGIGTNGTLKVFDFDLNTSGPAGFFRLNKP